VYFRGINETPMLLLNHTASAQNYFSITNNANGSRPSIIATGNSDANVTGRLMAKGTGGWDIADGAGATKIGINTTGIGFFGATPVSQRTMAAATGTATRTTFATFAGQTISASPTQAQVQAIDDHVKILSEHMKALIDDARSLGTHT
jgi:hypothetical protein